MHTTVISLYCLNKCEILPLATKKEMHANMRRVRKVKIHHV